MTSFFKYIVFISATLILLSLASLIVLYKVKPPPATYPEKKDDTLIKIAVLNGCGREGLASICARKLRKEGFDVVNGLGGNADSFDFDVSVVINRKGNIKGARYLAERFGISEILDQRSDNPYIIEDFVIILGRDWDTLDLFNEEDND